MGKELKNSNGTEATSKRGKKGTTVVHSSSKSTFDFTEKEIRSFVQSMNKFGGQLPRIQQMIEDANLTHKPVKVCLLIPH
jgi:hypothetical protein